MRGPFEVLSDCPACRVEAAFVELIDPRDRLGVALEGECRLCLHRVELGLEVREGVHFVDVEVALVALERWARAEGEGLGHFVRVNFAGQTPERVAAALVAGERVETGFDVVAFLFPGSGGGAGSGSSEGSEVPSAERAPPSSDTARPSTAPPPSSPEPTRPPSDASAPVPARAWDPRDYGRALATILVADGERRPAELRHVEAWLAARDLPRPPAEEVRVWRPHELGTPPDAAVLIGAMTACALADGEADGTEVRLLEEYARAWGLALDRSRLAHPSPAAGVWNTISGLFVR